MFSVIYVEDELGKEVRRDVEDRFKPSVAAPGLAIPGSVGELGEERVYETYSDLSGSLGHERTKAAFLAKLLLRVLWPDPDSEFVSGQSQSGLSDFRVVFSEDETLQCYEVYYGRCTEHGALQLGSESGKCATAEESRELYIDADVLLLDLKMSAGKSEIRSQFEEWALKEWAEGDVADAYRSSARENVPGEIEELWRGVEGAGLWGIAPILALDSKLRADCAILMTGFDPEKREGETERAVSKYAGPLTGIHRPPYVRLFEAQNTGNQKEVLRQIDQSYRLFQRGIVRSGERDVVMDAAHGDDPCIILGPSGAGKEHHAEVIHEEWCAAKERASSLEGNFRVINCSTIPESLAAETLFGHVEGIATDMNVASPGLFLSHCLEFHGLNPGRIRDEGFESAFEHWAGASNAPVRGRAQRDYCFESEGPAGSIFLDEFGDLPAKAQVQLLRFFEGNNIRPVGFFGVIRNIELRVLASTSDPGVASHFGHFELGTARGERSNLGPGVRPDLLFRLMRHVVPVSGITEENAGRLTRVYLSRNTQYPWTEGAVEKVVAFVRRRVKEETSLSRNDSKGNDREGGQVERKSRIPFGQWREIRALVDQIEGYLNRRLSVGRRDFFDERVNEALIMRFLERLPVLTPRADAGGRERAEDLDGHEAGIRWSSGTDETLGDGDAPSGAKERVGQHVMGAQAIDDLATAAEMVGTDGHFSEDKMYEQLKSVAEDRLKQPGDVGGKAEAVAEATIGLADEVGLEGSFDRWRVLNNEGVPDGRRRALVWGLERIIRDACGEINGRDVREIGLESFYLLVERFGDVGNLVEEELRDLQGKLDWRERFYKHSMTKRVLKSHFDFAKKSEGYFEIFFGLEQGGVTGPTAIDGFREALSVSNGVGYHWLYSQLDDVPDPEGEGDQRWSEWLSELMERAGPKEALMAFVFDYSPDGKNEIWWWDIAFSDCFLRGVEEDVKKVLDTGRGNFEDAHKLIYEVASGVSCHHRWLGRRDILRDSVLSWKERLVSEEVDVAEKKMFAEVVLASEGFFEALASAWRESLEGMSSHGPIQEWEMLLDGVDDGFLCKQGADVGRDWIRSVLQG